MLVDIGNIEYLKTPAHDQLLSRISHADRLVPEIISRGVSAFIGNINGYILYISQDLMVFNKPPGITTYGSSFYYQVGIQELVQELTGERLYPVHRLDRDTSGLLIFARNPGATRSLNNQFEKRQVSKMYAAIVDGRFPPYLAGIIAPLDETGLKTEVALSKTARKAATAFYPLAELTDSGGVYTLLMVKILTGRKHQIRAHLASLGHPIIGDQSYGGSQRWERPLLHAREVCFRQPRNSNKIVLRAPFSIDFKEFVSQTSFTPY